MSLRSTAIPLAVLVVSGCGASHPAPTDTTTADTTTANATATTTTEAAVVSPTAAPARPARWVDLQAGDCLADPPPEDPSVVYVTVVDCATPHSAQVFHRGGLRVNAALADIARTECDAGLTTFTGQGASGRYAVTFLIDSRQDRTDNNPIPSDVICVLTDPGGAKLTGSAGH